MDLGHQRLKTVIENFQSTKTSKVFYWIIKSGMTK